MATITPTAVRQITASVTPPISPTTDSMWWETVEQVLYRWDATDLAWKEVLGGIQIPWVSDAGWGPGRMRIGLNSQLPPAGAGIAIGPGADASGSADAICLGADAIATRDHTCHISSASLRLGAQPLTAPGMSKATTIILRDTTGAEWRLRVDTLGALTVTPA